MFPEKDYSGLRECFSNDGKSPNSMVESPKCRLCADCEYSVWKREDGRNIPPACKETISFMAIEENFSPFVIIFSGTAMPKIKALLSTLYLKAKLGKIQNKCLSLKSFSFDISLILTINEAGKFYVPAFTNVKEIETKENIKFIADLAETVSLIQEQKKVKIVEQKEEIEIEKFEGDAPPF